MSVVAYLIKEGCREMDGMMEEMQEASLGYGEMECGTLSFNCFPLEWLEPYKRKPLVELV